MPNIWGFFKSYNIYLSLSKISNVIIRIKYLKKRFVFFYSMWITMEKQLKTAMNVWNMS